MNRKQANIVLVVQNKWRLCTGDEPMPHTATEIGQAIDLVAKKCKWSLDDPDHGIYTTECREAHCFIDGGIEDNKAVFCQYCGGEIAQ